MNPNEVTIEDLPRTLIRRVQIDPASGCWRAANGWHDPDGYAQLAGRYAHREVWRRLIGDIPPGHVVDHVLKRGCIWRDCIWPVHLEPVTIAENNRRSRSASALNMAKNECSRCGCAFDLFSFEPDGRRHCRCCQRTRIPCPMQTTRRRRAA